jgi:hypothetical protein
VIHADGDILGGGVWFRTVFPPKEQYHQVHLETQTTGFIGEIALLTFADPDGPCDTSLIVEKDFDVRHSLYPRENDAEEV